MPGVVGFQYDQDQRYGSGYGGREGSGFGGREAAGEGPAGAHPYNARYGEREREPETTRGPMGRGQHPPPPRGGDPQHREWGESQADTNKWGRYDREV